MKKSTMVVIVAVVLVAVVLVSGMGLFPGSTSDGAKNKTATMTISFSDASPAHFRNNITTWINATGSWTYETHASGNGTTQFVFKNMTFGSNVMDLMMECSTVGDFSVGRQAYVGMGTIVQSVDGVANENPGRGWQYYVNGTYALVACDKTNLNGGEVIDWKFITLQGS
jgi:hypothetical protein